LENTPLPPGSINQSFERNMELEKYEKVEREEIYKKNGK
jgi:hypothetical protein